MKTRPLFLLFLAACTSSSATSDAGPGEPDAALPDAALPDARPGDVGADAGPMDAGTLPASEIGETVCPFEATCFGWVVSSCMGYHTGIDWAVIHTDARRRQASSVIPCVRAATTCDEYAACVDREACTESRCDGSVLVSCFNDRTQPFDCAADGLDCVDTDGSAMCGRAGVTCDGEQFRCEEGFSHWCPPAAGTTPRLTVNCVAEGKVCGGGDCVDPGPASCTETACSDNGEEIRYCLDGVFSTFACTDVDPQHRCILGDQPTCGIPTAACERGTRCEGDMVVVCQGGKEYEINCARAGGTCGDIGAAGASCVLPE